VEKHYYAYDTFLEDLKTLTHKINWEFDTILGVARGGITLAHFLGEYYNLREVYTLNTIGYEQTDKLQSVMVFNIPDITKAKNVLIVEDIIDSGDTMVEVLRVLKGKYPQINFKTASLFYKKSARIIPDWAAQEADKWIEFFWTFDIKRDN
jgi:xanthine phosphoribosyltransferase